MEFLAQQEIREGEIDESGGESKEHPHKSRVITTSDEWLRHLRDELVRHKIHSEPLLSRHNLENASLLPILSTIKAIYGHNPHKCVYGLADGRACGSERNSGDVQSFHPCNFAVSISIQPRTLPNT